MTRMDRKLLRKLTHFFQRKHQLVLVAPIEIGSSSAAIEERISGQQKFLVAEKTHASCGMPWGVNNLDLLIAQL